MKAIWIYREAIWNSESSEDWKNKLYCLKGRNEKQQRLEKIIQAIEAKRKKVIDIISIVNRDAKS